MKITMTLGLDFKLLEWINNYAAGLQLPSRWLRDHDIVYIDDHHLKFDKAKLSIEYYLKEPDTVLQSIPLADPESINNIRKLIAWIALSRSELYITKTLDNIKIEETEKSIKFMQRDIGVSKTYKL